MILLTLSRGKGEETVRLQLPASPAEIGETFAFLDRISLDTTATAILDVSSNVPVLYRCLYDVDVEDSEQFQKLQKLAERTEALSPAKAAIFSGALDAECVWNLEGALTVADRLDEYTALTVEQGVRFLESHILPHQNRSILKNRADEIAMQFQSVLAKNNCQGIRTQAEKKEVASAWLELAISCAKVPVKYEADEIKRRQKEEKTQREAEPVMA